MTREEREEAIKCFKNMKKGVFPFNGNWLYDMAIKALEQEPCEDAISRQAALVRIKNLYPDMPDVDYIAARQEWLKKYAPYMECENVIEQLPSVTPQEPKTGHWIDHDKHIECDKCKTWFLKDHLIRKSYCPNCGAKMIEPHESGV